MQKQEYSLLSHESINNYFLQFKRLCHPLTEHKQYHETCLTHPALGMVNMQNEHTVINPQTVIHQLHHEFLKRTITSAEMSSSLWYLCKKRQCRMERGANFLDNFLVMNSSTSSDSKGQKQAHLLV